MGFSCCTRLPIIFPRHIVTHGLTNIFFQTACCRQSSSLVKQWKTSLSWRIGTTSGLITTKLWWPGTITLTTTGPSSPENTVNGSTVCGNTIYSHWQEHFAPGEFNSGKLSCQRTVCRAGMSQFADHCAISSKRPSYFQIFTRTCGRSPAGRPELSSGKLRMFLFFALNCTGSFDPDELHAKNISGNSLK